MIEGTNIRIDTRVTGTPFAIGEKRTILAHPDLPVGTTGLFLNAVVVEPPGDGYLTAWTVGSRPNKSFVNYKAGADFATGFTYVGLSGYGTFELYCAGGGHVVLDLVGAVVTS